MPFHDVVTSTHDSTLGWEPRLLINGQLEPPSTNDFFETLDPTTGRKIADVPAASPDDVDKAVRAAEHSLKRGWGALSPRRRSEILWELGEQLRRNAEELAYLDTLENGKPLTIAKADVETAAEHFQYMAGWATKIDGQTKLTSTSEPLFSYTQREPVGVVAQIIPWNFPIVSVAWKIAPALAAGCTVVLKPAEATSLSALKFAELTLASDLPAGTVNILSGDGRTTGASLASHPGVRKISFTGSTATGRALQHIAADSMKRVSLELGGKSPVIVMPDADVSKAGTIAAHAIFHNQGEVCTAGSRLLVHASKCDEVVAMVKARAQEIVVGDPFVETTDMGPLISEEHRAKVDGFVQRAVDDGSDLITGGNTLGTRGYFYEPTVVGVDRLDREIAQDEIFGPVLAIHRFEDRNLDKVAELANDSVYGLGATVITENLGEAHRLVNQIDAGTIWVNTHHQHDDNVPFGGTKMSGYGRELGGDGVLGYTELKTVRISLN